MNRPILNLTSPDQICIVVHDIDSAVENFSNLFNIGPFRIVDWPCKGIDPESTYMGDPGEWEMKLAFAQAGQLQIEFVEPRSGSSIFHDFLKQHGPGLHHFRFSVKDFDDKVAQLESNGIRKIGSGTGAHIGSKWAQFDTTGLFGCVIEIRKDPVDEQGESKWADNHENHKHNR